MVTEELLQKYLIKLNEFHENAKNIKWSDIGTDKPVIQKHTKLAKECIKLEFELFGVK